MTGPVAKLARARQVRQQEQRMPWDDLRDLDEQQEYTTNSGEYACGQERGAVRSIK